VNVSMHTYVLQCFSGACCAMVQIEILFVCLFVCCLGRQRQKVMVVIIAN